MCVFGHAAVFGGVLITIKKGMGGACGFSLRVFGGFDSLLKGLILRNSLTIGLSIRRDDAPRAVVVAKKRTFNISA